MKPICRNIRERRKELHMTLEQLAKLVGTSKQTIARYEDGTIQNIPYEKIEALALALRTNPVALMGWEPEPYPIGLSIDKKVSGLGHGQIDIHVRGSEPVDYNKIEEYLREIAKIMRKVDDESSQEIVKRAYEILELYEYRLIKNNPPEQLC